MLQNLKSKRQEEGFTIIEVMIVLVIAAVILLIVFLAVPALQRNARNTTIKNDAAAVLAALTEFQTNNNGASPTAGGISQTGQIVTVSSDAAGTWTPSTAKVSNGTTVNANAIMPSNPGIISIKLNSKCNGNAYATTNTPRAYAVGFAIENGNAVPLPSQCVES